MSQNDYNTQSSLDHNDIQALMARGRRMRSEAFIRGLCTLFQAPGNALHKAQPKAMVHDARKGHA